MARIHRIGEPENASEAKAIRTLGETLPADWLVFHNFELTTGSGLPYEYDIVVVSDRAVWHAEVKGYGGTISGDAHQWVFENGGVQPSPIPLANKKTKILASKLRRHSRRLEEAWVDTCILLTEDRAKVRIRDEQAVRVIRLDEAFDHFTDASKLPVATRDISPLHDAIAEALFGSKPSRKVSRIGLYDVVEKINQTDTRTVFLAKHRYIRTRPQTILKVFHFDVYAPEEDRSRQIESIFHDQDAMRILGAHPNLIGTGDMFAWDDDKFVLPTEYVDRGRPLEVLLAKDGETSLAWTQKADIVAKMARGLRHAHSRGVIHRDIRPLNVVVAPDGVVKLVNFDLALIEGSPELNDPKGLKRRLDVRYAAPEVISDPGSATRRSDVYSLGIVFYELITGERPYEDPREARSPPVDRDRLVAALAQAQGGRILRSPQDAAEVIERMCRIDPRQRYEGVDGVIEDLAILSDG